MRSNVVFFSTVTTMIMRKTKWLHAVTTMHMGVTLNNIKNKGEKHSRFNNLQE